MNTPNTHTQLPENLIVVDREWLEDKIRVWEDYWEKTDGKKEGEIFDVIEELKAVSDNSYPLTPILEDAVHYGLNYNYEGTTDYYKQSYLSQLITLKKI
jgi:hypothetical protein